ncbi:MAG: VWA domain-containing protein [Elusimicrobia bacterium]|nr:VWA domain-containing protein [Elusimicrobiota bacterium]
MFRNPSALLWLLPAVAAALGLHAWAAARRRALTETLGDPATIARLVPPETAGRRRLKAALLSSGLALLVLALAGPQWGVELVETKAPLRHVVIALDLSLSMMTEDVKPNRLEKAKRELSMLLDDLRGNRVGVVAFAGEAAVFCPITTDVDAAKQILEALEVKALPRPGTAIAKAVDLASGALERYPGGRAIVLITDGEDTSGSPTALNDAARRAGRSGIQIFPIGIGTPEGEPIPLRDADGATAGYKKDAKGNTVVSRLGESALSEAAALTGGTYYRATLGESEASEIAEKIAALEKAEGMVGKAQRYKNKFMIPLALAFLLLLVEMLIPETAARSARRREESLEVVHAKETFHHAIH